MNRRSFFGAIAALFAGRKVAGAVVPSACPSPITADSIRAGTITVSEYVPRNMVYFYSPTIWENPTVWTKFSQKANEARLDIDRAMREAFYKIPPAPLTPEVNDWLDAELEDDLGD